MHSFVSRKSGGRPFKTTAALLSLPPSQLGLKPRFDSDRYHAGPSLEKDFQRPSTHTLFLSTAQPLSEAQLAGRAPLPTTLRPVALRQPFVTSISFLSSGWQVHAAQIHTLPPFRPFARLTVPASSPLHTRVGPGRFEINQFIAPPSLPHIATLPKLASLVVTDRSACHFRQRSINLNEICRCQSPLPIAGRD